MPNWFIGNGNFGELLRLANARQGLVSSVRDSLFCGVTVVEELGVALGPLATARPSLRQSFGRNRGSSTRKPSLGSVLQIHKS